jgi:mono/diheme cytochrome c family protein
LVFHLVAVAVEVPVNRTLLAILTPLLLLTPFASAKAAVSSAGSPISGDPLFERDVLPILTANCLGCHGGLNKKAGLDLRSIELMLKGGEDGPAVKAGDASASPLYAAVANDEMPPDERKKLSPAEKQILRDWIAAKLPTVAQRRTPAENDPLLPPGQKHSAAEVAAAIDRHIEKGLAEAKLSPAARSDDVEFLRRVYLDLAGRVPTAEQAAAFLDDTAADKRAKLIDTLLASPDFGQQFGRTWRDWIAPPELPSDANGGKQPHDETRQLGKWIGDRIHAGDGWDTIARAMLTVEGERKNQPHLMFLPLQGEGGKTTPGGSARGVASLLLGVQLQCAQCHDDPYRTWSQQQYWQLAAFFGRTGGDFNKIVERPSADPKAKDDKKIRPPANPKLKPGEIEIPKAAFKNAGQAVAAQFLDGTTPTIPPPDQALRPVLADWLTDRKNPYFARAFANRTWFYFFNRGIVHPVDDLRDFNPPSHPGLLNLLEQEFVAGGFDVKHIVRAICNSQTYQRTSRPMPASIADSAGGDGGVQQVQKFGRMPGRVMTADLMYDSLKQVYGDPKLDLRTFDPKDGNANGESAAVGDALLEFQRAFCTNEEDTTDFTHGIPQMLTMINHPRLLAGSKALEAYLKANKAASPQQVVEWLYLGTLSRRPTEAEMAEATRYMSASPEPTKAYTGVLWMLVNRSEYLMVR